TYFSKFNGYYTTGDGAQRDKDGYLWVTGRIDDMINVSGHLLSTAQIESALVEHPKVAEAAVVGRHHDVKGESAYAFVTLKDGATFDDSLVRQLLVIVRERIGAFAAPDTIQEAPALPKTRSGKIMRRILREIAAKTPMLRAALLAASGSRIATRTALHHQSQLLGSTNRLVAMATAARDKHVSSSVRDGVAVLKFDSPDAKVNTLSKESQAELMSALRAAESNSDVKALVLISGKPACFIAGADIQMLASCKSAAEVTQLSKAGQADLQALEDCKKPVVAAIMGQCLGGGLEVALAAHYRIAVNDKKTVLGLPEVLLGLLPGAGGTQRLPRLVPITEALSMILQGKNVPAKKAKRIGLVHQLVEPLGPGLDAPENNTLRLLEDVAVETASGLASGRVKPTPRSPSLAERATAMMLNYSWGRNFIFERQARATVMKQTGGLYPAPLKIIDLLKACQERPQDRQFGFDLEAKSFGELAATPESKALFGLFFGQTETKKNRWGKPQRPTQCVGVLGAGLMGAGIAQVTIDKGLATVMKDANEAGLARGQEQIQSGLKGQVCG
uniref:enoyl-CoA hydratase n=1 Tax=Macrostomum lignano TaxID=282301 RepID=A0A1I8IV25_9PLAT